MPGIGEGLNENDPSVVPAFRATLFRQATLARAVESAVGPARPSLGSS